MSRVFVTGATGVLGRRVVPLLASCGHEVSAVVRSDERAARIRGAGVTPVRVDIFDGDAVAAAVAGHDAIAHLATNIPTGASMVTKRGWATNDRLRSEAAATLSRAAIATGIDRYVQESITFPYVDRGAEWIDEDVHREYFWGDRSTIDAEAAAAAVAAAGGAGVVLRFGMFIAADSAHLRTLSTMAGRGVWAWFGDDDAYFSFIHADDAAASVVAALEAPAGVYNVAEADPLPRAEHRAALATAVGRERLRRLPSLVEKASGPSAASLARSHRISSASLQDVTGWRPCLRPIDVWKDLA